MRAYKRFSLPILRKVDDRLRKRLILFCADDKIRFGKRIEFAAVSLCVAACEYNNRIRMLLPDPPKRLPGLSAAFRCDRAGIDDVKLRRPLKEGILF